MEFPPSAPPRSGALLLAAPWMGDPNFERTVVFLMEHNEDGTVGLVLNRPSPLTVLETVPEWRELVSPPDVIFVGGPVMPNNVVALGRARRPPATGWAELPHGLGAVDLNGEPSELAADLVALRLFAGYSGWGPGQLTDELRDGAWWVFPVGADDCFGTEPDKLWHAVIDRQPAPWRAYGQIDEEIGRN